jgi:hypothetical protein
MKPHRIDERTQGLLGPHRLPVQPFRKWAACPGWNLSNYDCDPCRPRMRFALLA